MGVKTIFLNGVVEEEEYVKQPLGFKTHDKKTHVCKLKKALYGLKHAPKTWYDKMDRLLMTLIFTESKADSNLCFKVEGGRSLMLLLCVDALRSRHGGVDKGSMQ